MFRMATANAFFWVGFSLAFWTRSLCYSTGTREHNLHHTVYLIQYCVFWAMLRGIPSVLGADRTRAWFDFVPPFRLQIWKNGDHWNFIMQGARYSTNDSHFMVRQLRHRF